MRVLAVAHDLGALVLEGQGAREVGALGIDPAAQPVGDGGVVGRGALVNLEGQAEVGFARHVAGVGVHLVEDHGVVSRVDHHGHRLVVLGRAAQHGRPADIDIFDGILEGAVGVGDRRLEGVEVDHHHVDRRDAVLRHLGDMGRIVAQAEQAAVDLRVQGLDPAVEHFRIAGVLGDIFHLEPGLAHHAGGAAGGEDFDAEVAQVLGEIDDAGFVGDTDQCTFDDSHGRTS